MGVLKESAEDIKKWKVEKFEYKETFFELKELLNLKNFPNLVTIS